MTGTGRLRPLVILFAVATTLAGGSPPCEARSRGFAPPSLAAGRQPFRPRVGQTPFPARDEGFVPASMATGGNVGHPAGRDGHLLVAAGNQGDVQENTPSPGSAAIPTPPGTGSGSAPEVATGATAGPGVGTASAVAGGAAADAGFLPPAGFAPGWVADGAVETFERDTLYEHINGEAELYLPYGFERLTTAYFKPVDGPKTGLGVDLYRMGSPLDAFGIFSNYRSPEGEEAAIGAGSEISDYHLLFWQDRFFVRLSASGGKPGRPVLRAAAEAVAKALPGPATTPAELALLAIPERIARTEKFVAASLLGYSFFPKGLTADATLDGRPVRLFVVLTPSAASAGAALDAYVSELARAGSPPPTRPTETASPSGAPGGDPATSREPALLARDPLYKVVVLQRSGPLLFGIARLEDPAAGAALLARWMGGRPR